MVLAEQMKGGEGGWEAGGRGSRNCSELIFPQQRHNSFIDTVGTWFRCHAHTGGVMCARTHTHTQWNTQVAAAAGFSRGCQRPQTPLSCWTYGSSLTLGNLCSRRALPSAEINQP